MLPLDRLDQITERFDYLEARLAEGGGDIAALGREYAELRPVVAEIADYRAMLAATRRGRGDAGRSRDAGAGRGRTGAC